MERKCSRPRKPGATMMIRSLSPVPSPAGSAVQTEHCDEPLSPGETGHIWQAQGVDVELLHGQYRTFSFARHFHASAAIGVVETGVMRTYCQNRTHRVPAGSVILLNPGDVHAPQGATGGGWSFRMFYLNDALVRALSGPPHDARPMWFGQPFLADRALYSSLLQIHRRLECDADSFEAESLLATGLAHIAHHAPRAAKPEYRHPGRARIDRAREFLHSSWSTNITLRELSAMAELSPYHFLRSFRAQVGITPHAYLTQVRIEHGRRLLRSGWSIADAALQSGFTDQSHFTRQFKRFTGVTPGKYLPMGRERRS